MSLVLGMGVTCDREKETVTTHKDNCTSSLLERYDKGNKTLRPHLV